jgi:SAM-dependent methyltransferase
MPADSLSDKASHGFAKAALYDQHRPSYPPEALAMLLDAAEVSGVEGAHLIDLGAGTGKFTEILAAREERFNIVAVEPHPAMREQLEHKSLNNVNVVEGSSTAIPVDGGSVDAVFAAQVRIHACFASSRSLAVSYCCGSLHQNASWFANWFRTWWRLPHIVPESTLRRRR